MNIATLMMTLAGTTLMLRDGAIEPMLARMAVKIAAGGMPGVGAVVGGAGAGGAGGGQVGVSDMGDPEKPTLTESLRKFLLNMLGVPVERLKDAVGNEVVVVRIVGPVMTDAIDAWLSSGVWTDALVAALEGLAAESSASPVVLVWGCPGGNVLGLTGILAAVDRLRESRPVHSLADDCMCSLAYYIGCSSDTIAATPTSFVGSIGCRNTITSVVRALDDAGVDIKNVSTGFIKLYGDPAEPITDAVVVHYQARVDEHGSEFFRHVAGMRGLSVEAVEGMQGDCYWGRDAMDRGLVDEVVTDPKAWILSKAGPVRPGAALAGGRPGRRALSASAHGVTTMNAKELREKFGAAVAEIEASAKETGKNEGFALGRAEGLAAGKAEATPKAASVADLRAKFPAPGDALFREQCQVDGLSMSAAIEKYNGLLVAKVADLEAKNNDLAERNAAAGGAGKSLEASGRALNQNGGTGGAGDDGLSDGVKAFKGAVEAGVGAGKSLAAAIADATAAHGAHYMDWVKAGQPGSKKPEGK